MNDSEFEFVLFDRIEKIRQINKEYDLENNAYLSFSGGKDSTVLSYLIDLALPGNKIPRVFLNTGIEYREIVKFVKQLAEKDDRIILLKPSKNIKKVLEEFGYPFKSKEHSQKVFEFNRSGMLPYIKRYVEGVNKEGGASLFGCPQVLKYQFTEDFKNNGFKISKFCCDKMKKEPAKKWAEENNKTITITGMMREEGGFRASLSCITYKKDDGFKFHPLSVISKEFEETFIKKYEIQLCCLYYPPFNFESTGCKGCPFALKLQDVLDVMEVFFPNEKKQCEELWKPAYSEYRRLGYRLRKESEGRQMAIDEFL